MTSLLRRAWAGLPGAALLAGALLTLPACEDPTSIGNALQLNDGTLTTSYADTFTVRTSTVLTDSVPSSTSTYLLAGRYQDGRLGAVTGRSYFQLGLTTTLAPDPTAVFDSVVLELTPDTYRYGDTTRTQTLQVHRLQADLRGTTTYYTADSRAYDATVLGQRTFRAGKQLSTLHLPLDASLGRRLFGLAQQGSLSTTDQLLYQLPGLALTPAPTDDAALLRFTVAGSTLHLYYHLPATLDQAEDLSFSADNGGGHFYQLEADRRGTLLASLTRLRQAVPSTSTAEETYIQAGLGLQTKVEFPYLLDLKEIGGNIVINAATLEMEVVSDSENRYLPPPATLDVRLTDAGNHLGSYFANAAGTGTTTATYQRGISSHTGLERGLYNLSLTPYCTQALARNIANTGVLIGPGSGDVAERVVLGNRRNANAPMRLRVYFTRVNL